MIGEKFFGKKITPQEELRQRYTKKKLTEYNAPEKKHAGMDSRFNPNVNRREALGMIGGFVKNVAIAGGVLGGGAVIGEMAKKMAGKKNEKPTEIKKEEKPAIIETKEEEKDEDENEEELVFESDFVDLQEEEKRKLRETFIKPSVNEKFKIPSADAITTYYVNEAKEQDKKTNGYSSAKEKIDGNSLILDKYFKGKNFPSEIVYLAIVESRWRPEVVSHSGAIGCYQVMPKTAETIYQRKNWDKNSVSGKKLNKKELREKVKKDLTNISRNAEVASEILQELFEAAKGSPDQEALALAGYNGSFFWEYKKNIDERNRATGKKEVMTYAGFLEMLGRKIEAKRVEILNSNSFVYKTKEIEKLDKNGKSVGRRLETIQEIAKHYCVPVDRLIEINAPKKKNKKTNKMETMPLKIKRGTPLTIPYHYKNREIKYTEEISGFLENLRYPGIYEGMLDSQKIRPTKKFAEHRKEEVETKKI